MKILSFNKFINSSFIKSQSKNLNSLYNNKAQLSYNNNERFIKFLKNSFKVNNENTILPISSIPIVAYMATTKKIRIERENNKAEEAINRFKSNDTEWNEKQSRKALKDHGITTKREQDKYIGSDGKLNTDGNKKVSFKGTSEEDVTNSETEFDLDNDPDLMMDPELEADLAEVKSAGFDMCPELQEVLDTPPLKTGADVIEATFGELPEGFDPDWDFWSVMKNIWDELLDIGDWF